MEETFTDKEFCRILKIDRATSLRCHNKQHLAPERRLRLSAGIRMPEALQGNVAQSLSGTCDHPKHRFAEGSFTCYCGKMTRKRMT